MQIHQLEQREDMEAKHKEIGFVFADMDGVYWDETLAVEFTSEEIEQFEVAATECHEIAMRAVETIMSSDNWKEELLSIGIPENMLSNIKTSWDKKEPSFYGRFDFAITFNNEGKLVPKCYEYNADTPTSLFEASIVQWNWLNDSGFPDQFNFIHEQLITHIQELKQNKEINLSSNGVFYLTSEDSIEDLSTIRYLQEVIQEATLWNTDLIEVNEIALANNHWSFLDARDENNVIPIESIFKLYPWEKFATGPFYEAVNKSQTKWIEPQWKLVLSSKGLLAKMYELEPDCPWLIPTRLATEEEKIILTNGSARFKTSEPFENFVLKPCLSREGSGVIIYKEQEVIKSKENELNSKQMVIQDFTPSYKTNYGTIMSGVWVVGGVACGLGIRLDGDITGDLARFLPHFFV